MSYDFDLCVIGGGSGGLSAAKTAADLGKKVCLVDFIKPSPYGTTWGLGGTCVNVGCIPKKLYHTSGIIGDLIEMSKEYGWKILPDDFEKNKSKYHDWSTLRNNIVNHIKSINFGYVVQMNEKKIEYKNSFATFIDKHKVRLVDEDGVEEFVTAENFILSMGGRPRYPNIKGAKYGISSDDIFHLEKDPKKTLLIGASYIALETAGFLRTIGKDVEVMVRSICLRGFDRECATKIKDNLKWHGVKFLQPISPLEIEKMKDERLKVHWVNNKTKEKGSSIYDTVIFAIGRVVGTNIGIEKLGVKLDKKGKVLVNDIEQTSVSNIYAIGDIINHQELTPVAIQTGKLLSKRLYENSKLKMDYNHVPTTVFTPLEYGTVGMSEEEAVKEYGKPFVDIYTVNSNVLEYSIAHKYSGNVAFTKVITYKFDDDKVVGFHYLGPNAGEVTQAMALAMKVGVKKSQLDLTVGIHPTTAEAFTTMYVKKQEATGC